ncbi:BON domain-containing protein [Noviherbaspirillum galbum]|uniref:BON domain-containing protein n=1 Tax=Noviherbaspirillum galbum TaxID=2709383 RepID=A0A6B3SNR3_9BURK|nr:BON domain-containing protein [Noviherbaspirillum galbum]NEX62361.1 BON domain-containing protein [Noviherbaspirillum galbum]
MKTDLQLREDVLEELEWDPLVDAADVGVEVRNGVVTLSGHLDSFAEKIAARRAVERVAGVKGIALEVDVRLPGQDTRSDTDIAVAARTALEQDALLPRDAVTVLVEAGRVTLSGRVGGDHLRRVAERDVRNLRGVRDVKNDIVVHPVVAPRNIRARIESALQRRAHAEAKAITVSVKEDEVTLTGTVPSLEERSAAVHAAWCAPGVTKVVNHIVIGP